MAVLSAPWRRPHGACSFGSLALAPSPLSVSWIKLVPANLRHLTPAYDAICKYQLLRGPGGSHASAPTLLRGHEQQPSRHTLAPLRAQNLVPTNLHHCCEPQEGSLVPTNMGARSPHCSCALGNTPPHALGEPPVWPLILYHQVSVNGHRGGMPLPSKTNATTRETEGLQHPARVLQVFSGLQSFVNLWAMRCVGLRTAGPRGGHVLHGARSHFGARGGHTLRTH